MENDNLIKFGTIMSVIRHLSFFKNLRKSVNFLDSVILVLSLKLKRKEISLPVLKRKVYIRRKTKDTETFEEIFNQNIYNLELPLSPETIIDAGANVGFATLFFKLKYPNSRIALVEIEKENIKMVEKNLQGLKDIKIYHKGLFNKIGFFKVEDPYNASNSFVIKEVAENEPYDIQSTTIDEIMQENNFQTVDILKIDIEGAEKDLFEKNYESWLPKIKIIMVETHDRMVPRSAFTVMNALDKYNFMLFTTAEGTMFYYNMNFIKL